MKKQVAVWCIICKNEWFPSKSMNFIFFTLARILAWGKEQFMIEKAKIIYSFAKKTLCRKIHNSNNEGPQWPKNGKKVVYNKN